MDTRPALRTRPPASALPRRIPMASLRPELRTAPPPGQLPRLLDAQPRQPRRSPQEVRALLSRYQQGLRQGRSHAAQRAAMVEP